MLAVMATSDSHLGTQQERMCLCRLCPVSCLSQGLLVLRHKRVSMSRSSIALVRWQRIRFMLSCVQLLTPHLGRRLRCACICCLIPVSCRRQLLLIISLLLCSLALRHKARWLRCSTHRGRSATLAKESQACH